MPEDQGNIEEKASGETTAGPACVRCGQCMSVCPVYGATRDETDVARGRMELFRINRDKGLATDGLRQSASRCLLCGACESVCAAGVKVREQTVEARGRGLKAEFPAAEKLALAALTGDSGKAKFLRRAGRLFSALSTGEVDNTSGLYLRFPASFFLNRKVIPKMAAEPFLQGFARLEQKNPARARIAFFTGCGANHIFTDTAWSVARLCQAFGLGLAAPENQGCCGLAAYSSGNEDLFLSCVEKNLAAFDPDRYDSILFVCASCLDHVRRVPQILGQKNPLYPAAKKMAEKSLDATLFFAGLPSVHALSGPLPPGVAPLRVFAHEPCHSRLGAAGPDMTKDLLALMGPAVTMVSAGEPSCCGHGGSFNAGFPDLSMSIAEPYMRKILKLAPDVIVSACTGCLLQLTEAAYRFSEGKLPRVLHPLALAAPLLTAR